MKNYNSFNNMVISCQITELEDKYNTDYSRITKAKIQKNKDLKTKYSILRILIT